MNTKIEFTFFLLSLLLIPGIPLAGGSLNEVHSNSNSGGNLSINQGSRGMFSPSARILASYDPHPPIRIQENSEFEAQASAGNWSGEGTLASPYVIEGLYITGSSGQEPIYIWNTDVFFRINSCLLEGGRDGIRLRNTMNGEIFGNTVTYNGRAGIYAQASSSNTIIGNTVTNNSGNGIYVWESSRYNIISGNTVTNNSGNGIYLQNSASNTIIGNIVTNNGGEGISLASSGNNRISDNILVNNGLAVSGSGLGDYLQVQVANNSVNGKPVVYWQHISGGSVPSGAGQVILVKCTAVTVTGQTLSHASMGVLAVFSSNLSIHNNTIFNNEGAGIFLESSGNSTITTNMVTNNGGEGISLATSGSNTITTNFVTNNGGEGISLASSGNNRISDNILLNNGFSIRGSNLEDYLQTEVANNSVNGKPVVYWQHLTGGSVPNGAAQIILVDCTGVTVTGLTLSQTSTGVLAVYSSDLSIHDNNIVNSRGDGIALEASSESIVSGNIVTNNSGNGFYLRESGSNSIIGNIVTNNSGNGFYVRDSSSNTIIGNTVINNDRNGITLESSVNGTVSGNTVTNNDQNGITLELSSNNAFFSNNLTNNRLAGIYLDISLRNNITSNTITYNGAGISMRHSIRNTISGNSVVNNSGNGIYLQDSASNTISNNIVNENGGTGVFLGSSWSSTILGNTVTNNTWVGIYLASSMNNTISENVVTDNSNWGIALSSTSFDNFVTWNDFIDNNPDESSQAFDDGQTNLFAHNYWNEWTEPDRDQNGVVDQPYRINGSANNQDDFPRTFSMLDPVNEPPVYIITAIMLLIVILAALGFSIRRQRRA